MVKLVEVQQRMNNFRLTEVYVNPEHVVAMREDERMTQVLREGKLPENLDDRQSFTKIYIDRGHTGIDMTVIGDVQQIKEKLGLNKRTLLKG
jgi:N-acetylmuramoyl-L-alanine amidase